MTPSWWNERRLGIFVHATLATVPAWAPIGQYAEWYRSHVGEPVDDVLLHPSPLPEVLAHHRDRWGHVDRYDDFAELLTFDRFDAEAWAELVDASGAGYTVFVAKHHDGWAWWDAPGSTKRLTEVGPRRDVLAEYAAACERHDIVVGAYLSLLDWGDPRYPTDDYVTDVLHPQAIDLVRRHGAAYLWGDGNWGHDPATWRTSRLIEQLHSIDPALLLNDRWGAPIGPDATLPVVQTFEYDVPDRIIDHPWELCRGLGPSFGHNRAEGQTHLLDGTAIVALYTEVLAKGGHLLLNVGPASDGTIPDVQAAPLRAAGDWIRRHADALAGTTPWLDWGDAAVRYLADGDDLLLIDVAGDGEFRSLADHRPIASLDPVGDDVELRWGQNADGLHVERPESDGPAVYRARLSPGIERISLFELEDDAAPTPLGPLLADASSGDIVQLGDGRYAGPIEVPPGVIVRGLGRDRTTVVAATHDSIVPAPPVVQLGRNARIEHLAIEERDGDRDERSRPLLEIDAPFGTVLGCDVRGSIRITADDAVVRATTTRTIRVESADRVLLSRCSLRGNRWNVGIRIQGGTDHEIESCSLNAHLCAIRLVDTVAPIVRGCRIEARWWAVHARAAVRAHVHGNQVRSTMRAVDVDGGNGSIVEGNAVTGGDSGCLVQAGAADTVVRGNHWNGPRAGLITWNADPWHGDNVCVDLGDPEAALVTGP